MNDYQIKNETKGLIACGRVSTIRLIYQVCFYISLVVLINIIIMLDDVEFLYYIIIAFGCFCSYAVLLVLRALEYLARHFLCLEQELIEKRIVTIDYQPPQQNN